MSFKVVTLKCLFNSGRMSFEDITKEANTGFFGLEGIRQAIIDRDGNEDEIVKVVIEITPELKDSNQT